MKKYFFAFILAFITTGAFAQLPLNIGFKFGLNSSEFSTKVADYNSETINNYLAGAFVRVNVKNFYVQPEVYFNTKGGELNPISNVGDVVTTIGKVDLKTVDVPILLGYKLIKKPAFNLRVNAGPVMSFITDQKLSDQAKAVITDFKNQVWGIQYGVGIDILMFTCDFRVENTGDVFSGDVLGSNSTKNYLITLGMKIF